MTVQRWVFCESACYPAIVYRMCGLNDDRSHDMRMVTHGSHTQKWIGRNVRSSSCTVIILPRSMPSSSSVFS